MKENNVIQLKSDDFAVRIINLYKELYNNKKEYVMSKQLLKCGTSTGANVNEAICGISVNDFLAKMYISFKECNETLYWLRLLYKTNYISSNDYNSLNKDCYEIRNILSSITKSTAEKIKNNI